MAEGMGRAKVIETDKQQSAWQQLQGMLQALGAGSQAFAPAAFGSVSRRAHPHRAEACKRYADGRQRDPAWRKAHDLPLPVNAALEFVKHVPARSAKAQVRYNLAHDPQLAAKIARAQVLNELRTLKKLRAKAAAR